ncbi:MAG: heat-inducible transcriptional repressor HrcA [Thermostichales cyanobacterium SRBZ-1_bins_19]
MAKPPLTARQHQILWATVRSYIETAEPVGSKALAENYNLGVSSATIRNILATLEQHGFLFQPHTSAGRIPSDLGYRVYVDDLLAQGEIEPRPVPILEEQPSWNLDSLLRKAAQLLAGLSGCLAVVTAPQAAMVAIRHLQLLEVAAHRIMVVVVTDSYQTYSILVDVPQEENWARDLPVLSNFLNYKLRGKTFADLQDLGWLQLDQEFRSYASWLADLLAMLAQRYLKPRLGQVYTAGMTELTRQPEFAQVQQLQAIFHLLEETPEALGTVLDPQPELVVYIGTENPLEPMRHCTLITASYTQGSQPLGSVAVLGPTRMVYEQALSSVQATTHYLSQTLSRCA